MLQISGRITGTSEGSITSNPLARNNFGSLSSTSLQQQNQALGLITNPLQEVSTNICHPLLSSHLSSADVILQI